MLILTRKPLESIIIGDEDIIIRILDMRRGQVKVGIEAPKSLSVHREEVFKKIKKDSERGEIKCAQIKEGKIINDISQVAMVA